VQSRIKHNIDVPVKEKKPSKKELALAQAALDLAAKVAAELAAKEAIEQATRDAAAKLLADQIARDEEIAKLHAQLAQEQELNRLRVKEQLAIAAELAKTPMERRREGWAAASKLTLQKNETEKVIRTDQKLESRERIAAQKAQALLIENDKKRTAKVLAAEVKEEKLKVLKAEQREVKLEERIENTLEKAIDKHQKYVSSVCEQEIKDFDRLLDAPHTLENYLQSPERIAHYKSPHYGYLSKDFIEAFNEAKESAMQGIRNEVMSDAEVTGSKVVIATLRGKNQLIHPSKFHASIKVRPWIPSDLKYHVFEYKDTPYECYYDWKTMRVYDFEQTIEIGYFNISHDIVFTASVSVLLECGIIVSREDIEHIVPHITTPKVCKSSILAYGHMDMYEEEKLQKLMSSREWQLKNMPSIYPNWDPDYDAKKAKSNS